MSVTISVLWRLTGVGLLGWAIAFIMAAVIVAGLAIVETTGIFAAAAKVWFWVFVAGFLVSLAMHYNGSRS